MATTLSPFVPKLKKEVFLFLGLLFFGFVIMPIGVWFVGQAVFGEYGGAGYADFFGTLSAKIRAGDRVAWFLVLAPWIIWQIARLSIFGWRSARKL